MELEAIRSLVRARVEVLRKAGESSEANKLEEELRRLDELSAQDRKIREGRVKGGKNRRLSENSRQIQDATQYLESTSWITPADEAFAYNCWRVEKGLKSLPNSTAISHLKMAKAIHKQKTK